MLGKYVKPPNMGNEKIQHSLYVGFDMSLHSVCVKIDGSPQKPIMSNF